MTNEAGNHPTIRAETVPSLELVKMRPKIARRRTKDRALINAIDSYALNRKTQAGPKALHHVEETL